mmetsp:Transcript_15569/g.28951  ORF Transcript_15569/g.28951 Transcript_15569/m.28951 type:complete len:248 (+) Transcript_15569:78-821(+)
MQCPRAPQFGPSLVIQPQQQVEAAVIWLHGMMDNPDHWARKIQEVAPPSWKVVLLRSPRFPISYLGGTVAAAWGDFKDRSAVHVGGEDHEREDCILPESVAEVHHAIDMLLQDGLPAERVAVAGFSQGAALAAEAALKFPQRLAALAVLCGWLTPGARSTLATGANRSTPVFLGHSQSDEEVEFECAEFLQRALVETGAPVKFYTMNHTAHIPASFKLLPQAVQFLSEAFAGDAIVSEEHTAVGSSL